MDRKKRPVSREKRIGAGSARVEKRGSGTLKDVNAPASGEGNIFGQRPAERRYDAPGSGRLPLC